MIENNGQHHYCLINDLSRLVSNQLNKQGHKVHICDRCLNYFYDMKKLEKHEVICRDVNHCAIEMPTNKILTFKNYSHQLYCPFVIYFDSECILKKVNDSGNVFQEHQISSIGMYLVNRWDDSKSYYKDFHEGDIVQQFVEELNKIADFVEKVIYL